MKTKYVAMMCVAFGMTSCEDSGVYVPVEEGRQTKYDPSKPKCPPKSWYKRVFVTREKVRSLDVSDQTCQAMADAQNLSGTWVAWMSTTTQDAKNRVKEAGPWYDMAGYLITSSMQDLATLGPVAPFGRDETGDKAYPGEPIWTGTRPNGTRAQDACSQPGLEAWSATSASLVGEGGSTGATRPNPMWTAGRSLPCNARAHVICFEQICPE